LRRLVGVQRDVQNSGGRVCLYPRLGVCSRGKTLQKDAHQKERKRKTIVSEKVPGPDKKSVWLSPQTHRQKSARLMVLGERGKAGEEKWNFYFTLCDAPGYEYTCALHSSQLS